MDEDFDKMEKQAIEHAINTNRRASRHSHHSEHETRNEPVSKRIEFEPKEQESHLYETVPHESKAHEPEMNENISHERRKRRFRLKLPNKDSSPLSLFSNIGTDEIIILAVMFIVFKEKKDNEMLLLLALLLLMK